MRSRSRQQDIELLANGDEYFPAMLKAIGSAKQTVNFATYILHSDEIGRQFRDAFCERARAGVEVRILLDGIGSGWRLNNSDVRMMRKAGCRFAYYHPTLSLRIDRTNRRLIAGFWSWTGKGRVHRRRWILR